MDIDREYVEFFDQAFDRALKGTNRSDVQTPVNEEAVFKMLLVRSIPSTQHISWLRHNIFSSAKKVINKESTSKAETTKVMDLLHSLLKVLEHTMLQPQPKIRMALFFPEDENSFSKLYRVLSSVKSSMDVCVFTITDKRIADVLIANHRRNVRVRVITDDDKSLDDGSDIQTLKDAGIDVRIDHSPAHMHHKFCIIDNSILINGSFNWTKSAVSQNNENVTVLEDSVLVNLYSQEFERLWKKFGPIPEEMTVREAAVKIQAAARGFLTRRNSMEFRRSFSFEKKGQDPAHDPGNNNNLPRSPNGHQAEPHGMYPRSPSMPIPHPGNNHHQSPIPPPHHNMSRAHSCPQPPRSPNAPSDHYPRSPNHSGHYPRSPSNEGHPRSPQPSDPHYPRSPGNTANYHPRSPQPSDIHYPRSPQPSDHQPPRSPNNEPHHHTRSSSGAGNLLSPNGGHH